ncbi:hypothetical protein L596_006937 [Steinernema carpocapsae]|uniref:Nematode cuticle collagen N-terminal domain-containing protein n=1 Tax=Steinernema carpocapsae TaxID=34508 RepID=A0A4U5P7M4_STECR|nr:hypothetical protein L596_006937 [Steinernema carpocapsae]
MFEEKATVFVASACSALAIIACLVVVTNLFHTIHEIHKEVVDGVEVFRLETDSAWTDMMEVQLSLIPPTKPRKNPFDSVFREKRQSYSGLPSWPTWNPWNGRNAWTDWTSWSGQQYPRPS